MADEIDMQAAPELKAGAEVSAGLVREIEAAIKRLNMYPPEHPASRMAAEVPFKTLQQALAKKPFVVFSLVEGRLGVDGKMIEGLAGKLIIAEALSTMNLKSISLNDAITFEGFQKFLRYFVGKSGNRVVWNDLREYAETNGITGVGVDELRYELVGEDEKIVSKDAVLASSRMEVTFAQILSDHPEYILGLLANKDSARNGIAREYASAIDLARIAQSLEKSVAELGDDQILAVILSGLKDHIKEARDYDEVDLQETIYKVRELVEKRNEAVLMPKIKRILEDLHLVDEKYLDLILDKKYSKKRLALDELERAKQGLEAGRVDAARFELAAKRLQIYDDEQYTGAFVENVMNRLCSPAESTKAVGPALTALIQGAVTAQYAPGLEAIYDRLLGSFRDLALPDKVFQNCLTAAIGLAEWLAQPENLPRFRELLDVLGVYASKEVVTSLEKRHAVLEFREEIGTNELAGRLIKHLETDFERVNRLVFDILRHIPTQAVALRLCDFISYPDRGVRLFVLRVLSELGDKTLRAFELMLSDQTLLQRSPGMSMLPTENWYKVRNIIFVCGNLASYEAVVMLERFVKDQDPRVAEEMILAAEKIKSEKACTILSSYLYFDDSKIRQRAAVALGNIGDRAGLKPLIEAFWHESELKPQLIPIIAKLGHEDALPFLRQLLLEKKESAWKSFLGMAGDEFRMVVVGAIAKIPSPQSLKILEEYKASFGGGLGSLFKSTRLVTAVDEARRKLQAALARKPAAEK